MIILIYDHLLIMIFDHLGPPPIAIIWIGVRCRNGSNAMTRNTNLKRSLSSFRGKPYLIKVDRNQSTDFCFSEHCVDQNDLTEVDGNQWFDEPCKHCDAAMQITNRGPNLMMQPPAIANVLQKNVGVHQYSEDWTPDTDKNVGVHQYCGVHSRKSRCTTCKCIF